MVSFQIEGKQIDVMRGEGSSLPLICLNTFAGDGQKIYEETKRMGCPEYHLAAVSSLQWDCDMVPWDAPPLSGQASPCVGGADAYLKLLTEEILPQTEKILNDAPSWRGIAGYSLGGLFAVYSLFRTGRFSRAASMSGSFWFPDIKEYIFSHPFKRVPDCLYFSLGRKEAKTRNPRLKTVQENTEEIAAFCRNLGIETEFRMQPGNHFVQAVERTAAGLKWMLEWKRRDFLSEPGMK